MKSTQLTTILIIVLSLVLQLRNIAVIYGIRKAEFFLSVLLNGYPPRCTDG
ncbi:unnamed protein product [Periconia digitata]|uniref:Uncharacterized protein n=1 Tax=Periconia digitata TaxID=1303443 RepID=A0A9W4XYJ5_9PLEO|nr:unnamed protein product [Periconia digitata]